LNETAVREKLRTYIATELIRDPSYPLQDDEAIISSGLIDSFALAELGVYVEDAFDVYIPDPDLTVAKMDTLNLMVARVLRDLPA
jgi:acyl carrier protein